MYTIHLSFSLLLSKSFYLNFCYQKVQLKLYFVSQMSKITICLLMMFLTVFTIFINAVIDNKNIYILY